jgi:hypothetical protein
MAWHGMESIPKFLLLLSHTRRISIMGGRERERETVSNTTLIELNDELINKGSEWNGMDEMNP